MKWLCNAVILFLLVAVCCVVVDAQQVAIEENRKVAAGKPGLGGLMKDPSSGGGGAGLVGGSSLYGYVWGPWFGPAFPGGPPLYEYSVTYRIAKEIVDEGASIVFNAWEGPGTGEVRWKPVAGSYTYVTETGIDSTTHYVPISSLPEDQVIVLYSARVTNDKQADMSFPADTMFTTDCKGAIGTPTTNAAYIFINNILEVTPDWKQKVRMRWKRLTPAPSGYTESAWVGTYSTSKSVDRYSRKRRNVRMGL